MRKVGLSKKTGSSFSAPARSPASSNSSSSVKVKREEEGVKRAREEEPSVKGANPEPWVCLHCHNKNFDLMLQCEFCDERRKSLAVEERRKIVVEEEAFEAELPSSPVAPTTSVRKMEFLPATRVKEQQTAKAELQRTQETVLARVKAAVMAVTDNAMEAAYVSDVVAWLLAGEQTRRLTLNTALAALDTVLVQQREKLQQEELERKIDAVDAKKAEAKAVDVKRVEAKSVVKSEVKKDPDGDGETKKTGEAKRAKLEVKQVEEEPKASLRKVEEKPMDANRSLKQVAEEPKLRKVEEKPVDLNRPLIMDVEEEDDFQPSKLKPLVKDLETPKVHSSAGSNLTLREGADEDDEDGASQGFCCYLRSLDGDDTPVLRVTWDHDVQFGRKSNFEASGYSREKNKFLVDDPRVSANHCRVTILDQTHIILSDSSTNGTCGIFQGKQTKLRGQTQELHFGDVFSLCCSDDFGNWRLSWQVCKTPDDKLVSLNPLKELDLVAPGDGKKKRVAPTTESMARVAGVSEGDQALADVLKQAGKKAKAAPKVISLKDKKTKKGKEAVDAAKSDSKALHQLLENRKKPAAPSNSVIVCEDGDDDEEIVFSKPPVAATMSKRKAPGPAPSLSFSLDLN